MSGFLYYLPDARGQVDNDLLSRFGLMHIRENDDPLLCREVIRGPGDKPGVIVGNVINFESAHVKQSQEIEWTIFPKSHAESQAYLGWRKGEPLPKPDALARKVQLDGEWLTLADGNRWLIPIARKVTEDGPRCALPLAFELDDDTGSWIPNKVRREYEAIWNHAIAYYNAMLAALDGRKEGGPVAFQIPDGTKLVEDALTANYRVSARELATLGVLVSGLAGEVAEILSDHIGYELLKKSAAEDTGSGSSGLDKSTAA